MIEFYPTNAPNSRRAFLEHLRRFARQDRDVSWTSAPEVFASTYGKGAEEAVTNSLRGAMEILLRPRRNPRRAPAGWQQQADRGRAEGEGEGQLSDHDAQAGRALRREAETYLDRATKRQPARLCSAAHAAHRPLCMRPLDSATKRRYLTRMDSSCLTSKFQEGN